MQPHGDEWRSALRDSLENERHLSGMKRGIAFQWLSPCPNERLAGAQQLLKKSVIEWGLEPILFPAGPQLVKFRDILDFACDRCFGDSFVWCNSDVLLSANPYTLPGGGLVRGFHRREIPSGDLCAGVDMYLIPKKFWRESLRPGMPDLWCGASHIDWWLTRAAALAGSYQSHNGFIDHPSHEESGASKSAANPYFKHNVREYNAWARRAGAGTYDQRISLPWIGESLSPVTDFLRLVAGRTKLSRNDS